MVLCSENYRKFYNTLLVDSVSAEDLFNLVPGAVTHIADELHIGKFGLRVEFAPSGAGESRGDVFSTLYEDPEGFEFYSHTRTLKMPGKDKASFAVFPAKGYSWNDEEKLAIDIVIKNIHSALTRARLNDQLNMRQMTDYLTMLPNTAYFTKFCNDLNIRGVLTRYTIVFSNLRSFNYINQQLGSRVGDTVLKEYSRKLAAFYNSDELIARFGGDNFVAILKNENVDKYLNHISLINISVATGNQTRTLGIAARSGICPVTTSTGNILDTVGRANYTLDYLKHNSDADHMYFNENILEKVRREREVVAYFRTALARKEFLVFYQPKVNLLTGGISGCEALVRWEREGRVISPADFVPVLEKEGLICDLDFYVLERVCENIRDWLDAGIVPAKVSVNFSKIHLRNESLVDDIMKVITRYKISPSYLEIELTETASSHAMKALEKFVDDMNARGICTSIDDFGTGYSSLSLLKDLHVSVIKIDKSFIDNIAVPGSRDRIILASIMSMVTGLGMDVIAEGCETAEQAGILRSMNCNVIQGYLFDKPLPLEEYSKKLADGHVYPIDL